MECRNPNILYLYAITALVKTFDAIFPLIDWYNFFFFILRFSKTYKFSGVCCGQHCADAFCGDHCDRHHVDRENQHVRLSLWLCLHRLI